MKFFLARDYRHKFRFFSSEPLQQIKVEFSRLKKILAAARQKLMLLPPKILRQEQAFENINRIKSNEISIYFSGKDSERKIRILFFLFLQKQKTKHLFLLIIETILLPVSGLMALIPGPNIFFGILALIIITHWQAFRGIIRLGKKTLSFTSSVSLKEWEQTLAKKDPTAFPAALKKIEQEFGLNDIQKILYK